MVKAFKAWLARQAPIMEAEVSNLDRMDGLVILCPPSHGAHCRCTWH